MRSTLTAQAGLLTGSRALGQLLNAFTGIFVVRALSQADYGTYRQLLLLYASILLFGDAGFSQALYKFIPPRREQAHRYLSQALVATLGLSVLWVAGLIPLSTWVAQFFGNGDLVPHMVLLAAFLGLSLLCKVPEAALITLERVRILALNTGFFESLKFAMVLAALWAGQGIRGLLQVMVIATALKLAHLLWAVRDQIRLVSPAGFSVQLRYAMVLLLPGLLNNAATYAHQYIVGYYFNPAQYAVYAVACFQVPLIGVLSTSVAEVLLVRATELHRQNRRKELLQVWLTACRKAQMVFLPVTFACAALAGPLLITLFTPRYAESRPLFIVIVLGLAFNGIFQDSILRACSAMRAYSFFYALRAVLALGLGIVGVRYYGLWGAAISTFGTMFILNVWQLVKVGQLLGVGFSTVLPWRDLGRISLVSGACAILAAVIARPIPLAPVALAAGGSAFALGYVALALRMGLLTPEETRGLIGQLRAGCNRLGILRPKVVT